MDRVVLKDLGFNTRNESMVFLKKLWRQEKENYPICGSNLELLHKKAKKSNCDWKCENCNKTYKTMHLLDEINEQMPE